ncbi:MAG: C4-dicarboxylate transporter substrate-binding protein, partial [Pseudomonadota bacterium]
MPAEFRSAARVAAACLASASLTLAAGLAQAQTKWDLASGYPLSNPHTVTLQQFAKDVDIASAGKFKITVHPNGALYKAPEIMRAVESGQAQAGEVLMSLLVNQNPVFGLDSLPFLATGFDDAQRL